jgi:hypothetical protein
MLSRDERRVKILQISVVAFAVVNCNVRRIVI